MSTLNINRAELLISPINRDGQSRLFPCRLQPGTRKRECPRFERPDHRVPVSREALSPLCAPGDGACFLVVKHSLGDVIGPLGTRSMRR